MKRSHDSALVRAAPSTVHSSLFTLLLLLAGMATTARGTITATGGAVTNYWDAGGTKWTAHVFTSTVWNVTLNTNFNVTACAGGEWVQVLVVGGGGGGSGIVIVRYVLPGPPKETVILMR